MKRKVYSANIGFLSYIVEPEDIAALMYLSGRMTQLEGYPRKVAAEQTPLCTAVEFVEVEFGANANDEELSPIPAAP